MKTATENPVSIEARGIRRQFGLGVALLFVVPLLSLWYFTVSGVFSRSEPAVVLMLCSLVALVALGGFVLLLRAPRHIIRIRNRLEQVVDTELAYRARNKAPAAKRNEIETIDACMKLIVEELRRRIVALQSERATLQEHLIQAEKLVALGTMATGVAHDFNNLMAAIAGNANILLHGLPPDSPVRENAIQIQHTVQQAVVLTNQVALYAGHGRFDPLPVDLSDMVRNMAESLRAFMPKGVGIDFRLADHLPPLEADAVQLRLMVTNLVRNASEAMVTGHGTITVSTGITTCDRADLADTYLQETLPEGRYQCLEVADQGQGMTEDVRARIFDPFYTGRIRAQGMGLAAVMGIVRAHGGAIRVHSTPGRGSVFRVLLPSPEAPCA